MRLNKNSTKSTKVYQNSKIRNLFKVAKKTNFSSLCKKKVDKKFMIAAFAYLINYNEFETSESKCGC